VRLRFVGLAVAPLPFLHRKAADTSVSGEAVCVVSLLTHTARATRKDIKSISRLSTKLLATFEPLRVITTFAAKT
jgi:hypothetical protein